MRVLICCIAFLCAITKTHAGDYEKAWEALHKNDKKQAYELFRKVLKNDPAHKQNAIATLILMESYDGGATTFLDRYPNPLDVFTDCNPYTYALWFSEGIFGSYGVKKGKQLENLRRVATEPRFNGSMRTAANYFQGFSLVRGMQLSEGTAVWSKIGALNNWQLVGPFDNISGSGFNKDYGPIHEPDSGKGFTSYNNAHIDWFRPVVADSAGWYFVNSVFPAPNAVGYAQTFVNSPEERDAMLCLGGNGMMKVWVNDKLVIVQDEELVTEMDRFNVKVHLKKGYNRVLVQIGFTSDNGMSNFIVRLTDDKFESLRLPCAETVQPYTADNSTTVPELQPHFAEAYFKKQVEKYPNDPIYAVLLAKCYVRSQQRDKAKEALYATFEKNPTDPLLLVQYLDCMSWKYDQTEASAFIEVLKQVDPGNTYVLQLRESELEKEKNYTEAMAVIDTLEARDGESATTLVRKVYLHAYMQHVDSMVSVLKRGYELYPDNFDIVAYMYQYAQKMLKDPAAAVKILEKYTATNNHQDALQQLSEDYFQQNEREKGLAALRKIILMGPYRLESYTPIVTHFYAGQQYDSAIHYLETEHRISPYYHYPLGMIGSCYQQKGDKAKALEYYKKALALYAGESVYRQRIRELENKPDVFSYFPKTDYYAAINKALKAPQDTAKSYYYIFDEVNTVLYGEGANEQVFNTAVHINRKDAVSRWQENSIPYNSTYSDLTIIKAEVIKANGTKVPAETYDNNIVFTKLEPGDVIYYNYKLSSFGIGRLGREYWDKFYFQASVPTALSRYSILVADPVKINYVLTNAPDVQPKISQQENFSLYTWEMQHVPAYKDEVYAPNVGDISKVLHVSTVPSWDVIAEWYSDLTRLQSRENFEVLKALKQIFPKGDAEKLSDSEKARRIYNFIEENINYSSVAFRQGAYVPQRASKTLTTRMGDCKDVSTLFVSLARKVGLDANLVLVSTRDNGQQGMLLPSLEFNHCIVRLKEGGQDRYLELTDNQLSYHSLPASDYGSQVLNIPFNHDVKETISLLKPVTPYDMSVIRRTKVVIGATDLKVRTAVKVKGEIASAMRSRYADKDEEEVKDLLQESAAAGYKNPVTLDSFRTVNLDNLEDSVEISSVYTVKNEVIGVGDISMVKAPLTDVVATSDIFTNEVRQYPFEYWRYENANRYETEVELELPAGKKFDQVPQDVKATFGDMTYELVYRKVEPGKLIINRRFLTSIRESIPASEAGKMKDFFNLIVNAEQKYISFK